MTLENRVWKKGELAWVLKYKGETTYDSAYVDEPRTGSIESTIKYETIAEIWELRGEIDADCDRLAEREGKPIELVPVRVKNLSIGEWIEVEEDGSPKPMSSHNRQN